MLLLARPEKASLSYTAYWGETFSSLIVDCVSDSDDTALEIGDSHVFATESHRSNIIGERKSCGLRVWIQHKTSLSQESIDKMQLSEAKIGKLGFYPPIQARDFIPGCPATLEASIFISDDLFDRIVSSLQAGKVITFLELELRECGLLEYGWEPDGSRAVWKIQSVAEPSFVDVKFAKIIIGLS